MNAPTIVIPGDPRDQNSPQLILDLGILGIKSDLEKVEIEDFLFKKKKIFQDLNSENRVRVENDFYDKFTITLKKVQVEKNQFVSLLELFFFIQVLLIPGIIKDNSSVPWNVDPKIPLTIIRNFDIQLQLLQSIQPNEISLTKLKINIPNYFISSPGQKLPDFYLFLLLN
jgi:hypothetical protein